MADIGYSSLDNQFRNILEAGIKKLSLALSDQKIESLLAYHQLLIKWNKAYNLTAVRDPATMISRHLLDSLTIVPFLTGQRFIDVGAGAGLPGIVLAIVFPEYEFDLLDSNGKKTRFLFQVKTELGLENVNIHHCRVEQHQTAPLYDGVISRAFATLVDMVNGSKQLIGENGFFYAMKGVYPENELSQLATLSDHYQLEACHSLKVPGDSGQRHLVVLSKV